MVTLMTVINSLLEKGCWEDPLTCYYIASNVPSFYVGTLKGERGKTVDYFLGSDGKG